MKPLQIGEVSVPAQWIRPTGSRKARPKALKTPGLSGEAQPVDQCSLIQSISMKPIGSSASFPKVTVHGSDYVL